LVLSSFLVKANVAVTPATGGNCLQLAPGGSYTVLSNITITEASATDFSIQTGATFILTAPAGFEFRPGIGNVVFLSGRDITSASLVVTASTITVTMTVSNNTQMDYFRIRSIETRAITANGTGNILRTATGGTANIAGDIPGGGINHGSLFATGSGGTFTTVSNGVWSNPATWTGGVVPSCTDNVSIKHQVNVDVVVSLGNLTINSGGNLISDQVVTVTGTFAVVGNGIYTHNNIGDAATTIFAGTESIANTSSIIVNKWKSYTVPFMTNVNGDVGNITFNTTGYWNQGGLFAPAKILGSLTVNAGTLVMDDGSGMSTALAVNDVIIAGTGRILFQTGTPRDLNLITGNFSDNSTTSGYTSIMYHSVGNLIMQVNGDLTINHRFSGIEGVNAGDVGSAMVTVTGNFTVSGGTFEFLKRMTGSLNMSVNGLTHITGSPTMVSFKDYYTGDVTFNSGSTTIENNKSNYILGTHGVVGAVSINITGDLSLNGALTRLYIATNDTNYNNVSVNVSNDMFLNGSLCYTTTGGFVEYNIGRNYTQSGTTSIFYGQRSLVGYGDVAFDVNGSFTVMDGTFVQSRSLGSITLDVAEIITIQDADFYGMNNTTAGNNGIATLICTDMDISGSIFELHRGEITDSRTISVTISNQLTINFANASDRVVFVGRASNNNAMLNLNIGSNFYTIGSASGLFCSSISAGNETITIGGDLAVGAGRVRFNAYENLSARGHVVNGTILGSVILSGGSLAFSSNEGVT
ncbi:MAG TPA: hypothetical protein PKD91_07460, partial [Bacteroidia bacterium]|nr:hypothetical protein [Bacteroidia bacterium]